MTNASTPLRDEEPLLQRFKSLESKKISPSAKTLVWQAFGVLGETLFKRYPPDLSQRKNGKRLLNLGCGEVRIPGFVNADFYRIHKLHATNRPDWMLDITRPLKCQNDYWDGIIMEHVNEHITYVANYYLFKELYRTLKSGGVLRIVVPDLDKYLQFKVRDNEEKKMNRYGSLPEAISNLTQNHAHISTWNYDLLSTVLAEVGFSHISKQNFGEGIDPDLLVDSPNHVWQSSYCEAVK